MGVGAKVVDTRLVDPKFKAAGLAGIDVVRYEVIVSPVLVVDACYPQIVSLAIPVAQLEDVICSRPDGEGVRGKEVVAHLHPDHGLARGARRGKTASGVSPTGRGQQPQEGSQH
jgi:hypothetical protein